MELFTLEYSVKQKCFHITDLENVCEMNLSAILNRTPTDYLIIGVFDSFERASDIAKELRNKYPDTFVTLDL